MSEEPIVDKLKEKLQRTVKSRAVLSERSKQLAKQVEDFRRREEQTEQILSELLERQRELNFMLHRSNSVLHRIQDANAVLSTEFTELVKELPAPNAPDWEDRVNRINELFKKTGSIADEVQDDVFRKGIDTDRPATKTDSSKPEQASEEPVNTAPAELIATEPEPESIQETEPEECISTAEFTDHFEPIDIIEPENETAEPCEPTVVEAQFSGPDPVDPNVRKRLDRLFGQAGANTHQPADNTIDGDIPIGSDRPGLLSQLWREIFNRNKKNGKSDSEDVLQLEPEIIEIEPETSGDNDNTVDELVSAIDQSQQTVGAELSGLLDDTADEVEHISMDLIPEDESGTEYTVPEEASEPAAKPMSLWSRLTGKITAERRRRALVAIERVSAKQSRRSGAQS